MAKLYPPRIEGTIPAFTGTVLTVPFSMNQAVGATEVFGLALKIKRVNSNEVILTKQTVNFDAYSNCKAVFNLTEEELELFNTGQFYRVQLAYVGQDKNIGYFSTVGVIKYTALPEVSILGLEEMYSNLHTYDYVLCYHQTDDPTEKLYSSRLKLLDGNNNIIEDSGEVIHSVLNDTVPNEALESFIIPRDLESDQIYRLQGTITSANGIVKSTPKYKIIQRENSDMKFDEIKNLKLVAKTNFDDAYGSITLKPVKESKEVISGLFILSRSEATPPYEWKKIHKFIAKAEKIKDIEIKDVTIEQGKKYIYSLQQYNNSGIYSSRLLSNEIYTDFEDLFLLDGKRQLKIRLNPRVSSMKNTVVEAKVNTIGSKYPFITRNGYVDYKEFSLSGLISYQMDDNKFFMDWKQLGIEYNITGLIAENIAAERIFKLEALNWLNDGKPKILKSPTEGNYIVRLMGISMTPNDTVGRMLHTFNCTASEIAPFTYEKLTQYKFIELQEPDQMIKKWRTIPFSETVSDARTKTQTIQYKTGELLNGYYIYSLRLTDMLPGSLFYINNEPFYIGATGSYSAKVTSPIYSFRLPDDAKYTGSLMVEYEDVFYTDFDDIKNIRLVENPVVQFIGNPYWDFEEDKKINLIEYLTDIKTEIVNIPIARFTKRGVHKLYIPFGEDVKIILDELTGKVNSELSTSFYSNGNSFDEQYLVDLNELDKLSLYEIHYSAVGCKITTEKILPPEDVPNYPAYDTKIIYHKEGYPSKEPYTYFYWDPQHSLLIEDSFDLFDINVNQNWFNIKETEEREIKDFKYDYIQIGDGVIAELTVMQQVIDFSYEYNQDDVMLLKKEYEELYNQYQKNIVDINYNGDLDNDLKQVKAKYKELIKSIEKAIEEDYTKRGG